MPYKTTENKNKSLFGSNNHKNKRDFYQKLANLQVFDKKSLQICEFYAKHCVSFNKLADLRVFIKNLHCEFRKHKVYDKNLQICKFFFKPSLFS